MVDMMTTAKVEVGVGFSETGKHLQALSMITKRASIKVRCTSPPRHWIVGALVTLTLG